MLCWTNLMYPNCSDPGTSSWPMHIPASAKPEEELEQKPPIQLPVSTSKRGAWWWSSLAENLFPTKVTGRANPTFVEKENGLKGRRPPTLNTAGLGGPRTAQSKTISRCHLADTTRGCPKVHSSRQMSSPVLWKAEGPRDG